MSEASASVGPETRPQPKGGYPPAWHRFCQIRDCGSMGHRILSPDGLWIWSSQRQQWLDVDSVLGYFTSYEIAAAALAGCHTPPPGTAEAERRRFALGQRAWLVNAGDRLRRVADGLVDFATDPAGISEALASELADRKIDESPIHHAITQANRIVDVCGKILSAARAAAGAAIESHTVKAQDLVEGVGDDVYGVAIPVVDREPRSVAVGGMTPGIAAQLGIDSPSSHGGAEGTPSGRTDAPAPASNPHLPEGYAARLTASAPDRALVAKRAAACHMYEALDSVRTIVTVLCQSGNAPKGLEGVLGIVQDAISDADGETGGAQ